MILPSIAPSTGGKGLATGLEHRFRYVARLSNNAGGQNGNSWVVTSLPYLHYSSQTIEDMPAKVVLMGGGGAQWEWVEGTGYRGLFGTKRRLSAAGADFRLFEPDGGTSTFHGPDETANLRGRLKGSVDALGVATTVAYDANHRIVSEIRTDSQTGDEAGLFYAFATDGPHTGRILSVEKRLVRDGVGHPLRRWLFAYHSGGDAAGSLNDLKTAEEQVWDAAASAWAGAGKRYFRYYKANSSIGFVHGLRYVLDADGYARLSALGLDPESVALVPDAVLADFASEFYEYDASKRPSKVVKRAGTETSLFDRLQGDGDPGRNWARREVETRPDGAAQTTYLNRAGRPVLKILQSGGNAWAEYWEYDADDRETLHATPASIASFAEPADADENFSVTLKTAAGRIGTRDYYPESEGGEGSAPGYLKEEAVQEGSSGTPVKQRTLTYVERTVGGASVYRVANSTVYRDSAGGGGSPATTANAYTWRGSSFAVLQHTVTPPVVSTGENGTGATTTQDTVYDDYGNARWRKNERGRIDYAMHDRITGALRFRIEDADTALLEGVPSGWSTPGGFGSARRTDCESDLLGRATLVLGPAHLVPTKNAEGAVVAVPTRRAEFGVYLDTVREVRSARGGSTSGGLYTLGTVKRSRFNFANDEIETIEAARACACGPLSPSEAFPQSSWKRWRREFFNAAAYREESRVWHVIPATGEGFENVNYYSTRYGRDAMGRENRVAAPGGTLVRTVHDPRGLALSEWTGTDDTGATDDDPTGDGAPGNNLVLVTGNTYDGGNGNLIRRVRPVDSDSANDREELFDHDFRDRFVGEQHNDGTHAYFVRLTLDNLGQVVQTDHYHTGVISGNLTARSKAYFDARRRNYKDETYSVDPGTGAVGHALVGQRWHDASGNIVKETFQGSEGFVKRAFDAFEREIRSYTACNPSGGSNDGNPASDTVVEQGETLYDAAGNTVMLTAWQRFHDATGTGPLNGPSGAQPRARRSFLARWCDAIGRETTRADYGTHGGAALARPEVPPAASVTVLVTRTIHADTGEAAAIIAPDGTENRWKRDAIGREVETVENFKDAAPAADVNRTVRFGYHPSGNLETLTLVNDVTGDQTTRWIYGTTLEDSAVATGHLLRAKIYPGGDRTDHAYNRQGEGVRKEDGNGTVHEYLRDKMGRMRHDCVTALGPDTDDTVKRISTEYDPKRPSLVSKVSSHDDAEPGEGDVLNEVAKAYDGFGQEIGDSQEHEGEVDGNTPKVLYSHADGSSGNTARRTSITYPNGRQVNLGYGASDSITDLLSLVKDIAIDGEMGKKAEYIRVGLGRFVEITLPEPDVKMSMLRPGGGSDGDSGDPYDGFDRFGRVQQIRWEKITGGAILDGWKWGYDQASNRTWRKNLVAASGQDEAYGYDGLHQVIRDAVGTLNTNRTAIGGIPGEEEDFAYDPTGNWLGYRKDEGGATVLDQTRANNKDNQLVQIDGSSALLAYDRAGNATKVPPGVGGNWSKYFQPVWDAWNRIVEVKDENGATTQRNAYDGLTRRITKEAGGVVVHIYWSDRWKPLEERLDSETTAARSYLWGERPGHRDELILRDRDTDGNGILDERLYVTMDYFNGMAILGDGGEVMERYGFSAFGVRRAMAPNFSPRSTSLYAWDFGFQGHILDAETGWYNYGYRFYVPLLGRWPSRDPIEERGGLNLYCMTSNDPVGRLDFLGALELPSLVKDLNQIMLPWHGCSLAAKGANAIKACCAENSCKEPCLECCRTRMRNYSISFGLAASINPFCAIWGADQLANAERACISCCNEKKSTQPPDCCKSD